MSFFRVCLKLTFCLFCFFGALVLYAVLFFILMFCPSWRLRLASRLSQLLARSLTVIIGIRPEVSGRENLCDGSPGGYFFVSNHVSYVDGLVMGSLFPVIYVSKSELKKWPLIGALAEASGTLFIERGRKSSVVSALAAMEAVLKNKTNLLFFPEGTSTDGEALLPFQSVFFQAPVSVDAPIVPVSLVYEAVDGVPLGPQNKDFVYWYGAMTFADHFFNLLRRREITVRVVIHEPLSKDDGLTRKRASDLSYRLILAGIRPKEVMSP